VAIIKALNVNRDGVSHERGAVTFNRRGFHMSVPLLAFVAGAVGFAFCFLLAYLIMVLFSKPGDFIWLPVRLRLVLFFGLLVIVGLEVYWLHLLAGEG
jgi:hypothetical protein